MTPTNLPEGTPAAAAYPVVRHLIQTLREHGFTPVRVDDGQGHKATTSEGAMLDTIFAVDDCRAFFRRIGGPQQAVCLVLAQGARCVIDYSVTDRAFALAVDEALNSVEV